MATYYVKIGGSDAAAGTSAGTAWRTIGKLLGAAGMASTDTAYIGAGVYREAVTVAMTSAVAETFIIGDVDGAQTGDAGEVILTNFLNGWQDAASTSDVVNLASRDFLTFRYLTIIAGNTGNGIDGNTAGSTNITIDTCYIAGLRAEPIVYTGTFAAAATWTVKNSYLFAPISTTITATLPTGVGADHDINFQFNDCVLESSAAGNSCATILGSGASANKGGGVDFNRCTIKGGTSGISAGGTLLSTTSPCTVTDSLIFNSLGVTAGASGNITDLGGNVITGTLTNVTQHATTRIATAAPAMVISFGHEWMWGMQPRRTFAPFLPGLGRGHIGSATTDMEGRARPEGTGRFIDSGTATSATTNTLTQTGKTWGTNEHAGRLLRTTGGTGPNQVKVINSNTATALSIVSRDGNFSTTPDATTTYIIYEGPPATTLKASSGSTTTFVGGAGWSLNKWAGYDLAITAGTQSGTTRAIVSNTTTTLTTAAFPGAIDSTSVGSIYWPSTSLTAPGDTPGAFENHDTALKETTTTDAGSVGIVIHGPGSHEFLIPVDASSTTIAVKMQYDANHGTTNKPQAILLANGEIGVTTETKTMTSGAATWDTLTFAAQTPTAKGVVTVRLVSRSDTPYGRAYADTWTVS